MLRYVRFHIDKFDCECCGRMIKKGTIELSDGRRYGPQCSARARGIPRQPSAEIKRIEREAARLVVLAANAGWKAHYRPAEWTWIAKGYSGNIGWPLTDIYLTANGEYRAVVASESYMESAVYASSIVVLGCEPATGSLLLVADQNVLDGLAKSSGTVIRWTTLQYAQWRFNVGWDV